MAAKAYGQAEVRAFSREARRVCVRTEIYEGTSAQWRLEDTTAPENVGMESHQLSVVLEVKQGARPSTRRATWRRTATCTG